MVGNGKDQKWVPGLGMSDSSMGASETGRKRGRGSCKGHGRPWTDHRLLVEPVDLVFRWADYKARRAYYEPSGTWVTLEPKEADLLAILMINRGRAIDSIGLIEWLYPNPDYEPDWAKSSVTQYVYRLRKKLPGVIMTVGWGMGYIIPLPKESFLAVYISSKDRELLQQPGGFHKSYNRKYTPRNVKEPPIDPQINANNLQNDS